jgi:hypothetical protein
LLLLLLFSSRGKVSGEGLLLLGSDDGEKERGVPTRL